MFAIACLFVCFGLLEPSPHAQPQSLAEKVAGIKNEYEDRERKYRDDIRAAARDSEKTELARTAWDAFAKQRADGLTALIRDHRDDPTAFDGILVLVCTMHHPLRDDFVKLVQDRHAAHPKMGELCFDLRYRTNEKWAEDILKRAAESHPLTTARGQAVFALAEYNRYRGQPLRGNTDAEPEDALRFVAESQRLFADVTKNYANVPTPDGKSRLGDLAERHLTRLRNAPNLVVGRPAPELNGEDTDGKPLKLSDYRGKIVLLDFWGHW